MNRGAFYLKILVLLPLLLVPGLAAAEDNAPSLAEATAALTRLVSGREWDEVPLARPIPEEGQFRADKSGTHRSDSWTVDLAKGTFTFDIFNKNSNAMWHRSGTFARDGKLAWNAKVTKELRSAH